MRRDGLTEQEAAARGLPFEDSSSGQKVARNQPYADADTKVIIHDHVSPEKLDALLRGDQDKLDAMQGTASVEALLRRTQSGGFS